MAECGANTRGSGAPAPSALSACAVQVNTGARCPALPMCRRHDNVS